MFVKHMFVLKTKSKILKCANSSELFRLQDIIQSQQQLKLFNWFIKLGPNVCLLFKHGILPLQKDWIFFGLMHIATASCLGKNTIQGPCQF